MEQNKKYKIALPIMTNGLEYEDRVRKEILSVLKIYPNIEFKIFAMLPENKEYEGVTSYGVPFKSIYMPSREKYSSGAKTLHKAYEFYKVTKKDLKQFDAVWCGDYHSVVIALLTRNKPVLWDLHELPGMLLGNPIKRFILRRVFANCKVVLHANPQRIEYLRLQGCITDISKHTAIRNFPSFEKIDSEYDDKYKGFINWKRERNCIYLQGLKDSSRAARESIEAVLNIPNYIAVVVGDYPAETRNELEKKWGKSVIYDRVYFVGKIPQLKIPQYLVQCKTTLVFYKNVRPNNYYCEANRFYQAVIIGVPVVVGNNPPMQELVEKYSFGVVAKTDGCELGAIIVALKQVLENRTQYLKSIDRNKKFLTWEQQEGIIKLGIEKLLSNNY